MRLNWTLQDVGKVQRENRLASLPCASRTRTRLCDEWHFETYDQAREALKDILEEVRDRAEEQEGECSG
jgi:hypothetical protein